MKLDLLKRPTNLEVIVVKALKALKALKVLTPAPAPALVLVIDVDLDFLELLKDQKDAQITNQNLTNQKVIVVNKKRILNIY